MFSDHGLNIPSRERIQGREGKKGSRITKMSNIVGIRETIGMLRGSG